MADEQEKGFKVVDKRSFDADGSEKADAAEPEAQAQAAPPTEEPEGAATDEAAAGDMPIPEIDFVTFILSIYHSAGCHLGLSPNPETRTCEENLPLAKETIDILGMLQEKTQGNLTGEEERILSEILFNLRMAYVKAVKK
jgi:hypothetical protein